MAMSVTLVTGNVRGLGSRLRRDTIPNSCHSLDADTICLQEGHLSYRAYYADFHKLWTKGPLMWSGGTNQNDGVVILLTNKHWQILDEKVLYPF